MLTILKTLCVVLFCGMLASLFLPFYETFDHSYLPFDGTELSRRPNPDQTGFFGGGHFTTFNGFGSIYALFNINISIILLFQVLFVKDYRIFLRAARFLFIGSILWLVFLNSCVNPSLLTPSDKLLVGFTLLTGCETVLFIVASRITKIHLTR